MSVNRGLDGVRAVKEEMEERKAAGAATYGIVHLRIKNSGESAIVRFLHQGDEVYWNWTHQLPAKGNQRFGDPTPCLDQAGNNPAACPFCAAGEKRKFQGYMPLIWRNAPEYKKNSDGFRVKDAQGNFTQIGFADQIALWTQGVNVFDELNGKDATYRGLRSRDFRITRNGSGLATTYRIEPADPDAGPQPMSPEDVALWANNPIDFNVLLKPLPYEQLAAKLGQVQSSPRPVADGPPDTGVNPFMQTR